MTSRIIRRAHIACWLAVTWSPGVAMAQAATAVDPESWINTLLKIGYTIVQAVLGFLATIGIGRLAVRAMDKDRGGVSGAEVVTTVLGAAGAVMAAGLVQYLKTRVS